MTTPLGPILSMWEAEGHRHGEAFDACAGAVVIGEQPSTAAEVALGIARVQARRRRVAVADAVGELGPLEDLVPMDAPYGLVDSFFYGVSLNKVAYTVDPARNLIIFPSGAVPIDHEALLGSDRWPKLLDAFRAADGLLLIVAPAESSALASLIHAMDGVVLVGNVAAAPGTRVLAHARLPVMPARPTPSSVALVQPQSPFSFGPPPAPLPPMPAAPPPPPTAPVRQLLHDANGAALGVNEREDRLEPEEHAERVERGTGTGSLDEAPLGRDDPSAPHEGEPALVPPWAREEEFAEPVAPPAGSARAVSFWVAIVAGALIAAALLTWITTSMMSRNEGRDSFAAKADSAHLAARIIAASAPTALAATTRDSAGSGAAEEAAADSK
ncbi:MAG: hypothetical protein JJD97_15545, partial [Gemmatimonadaceae bacterium]|nr:hypothetical protein [Gemmatimonadaceae bacterium]